MLYRYNKPLIYYDMPVRCDVAEVDRVQNDQPINRRRVIRCFFCIFVEKKIIPNKNQTAC
jgi:hypothetical protein